MGDPFVVVFEIVGVVEVGIDVAFVVGIDVEAGVVVDGVIVFVYVIGNFDELHYFDAYKGFEFVVVIMLKIDYYYVAPCY